MSLHTTDLTARLDGQTDGHTDGMSGARTAALLGLHYCTFAAAVDDMIAQEGFPAPFIDRVYSGRRALRKWSYRAVTLWLEQRSYAPPKQTGAQRCAATTNRKAAAMSDALSAMRAKLQSTPHPS